MVKLGVLFEEKYGPSAGLELTESLFGKIDSKTGTYIKDGSIFKIVKCFNQPAHIFLLIYAMNKLLDLDKQGRHDALNNFITEIKTQDKGNNRPITQQAIKETLENTLHFFRTKERSDPKKEAPQGYTVNHFTLGSTYNNGVDDEQDSGIFPADFPSITF